MVNILIGLGVFALGVIIGVVATVCVVIGKGTFPTAASGGNKEEKGVAVVAECRAIESSSTRCGNNNREDFERGKGV